MLIDIHTHSSESTEAFSVCSLSVGNGFSVPAAGSGVVFSVGLHPWDIAGCGAMQWDRHDFLVQMESVVANPSVSMVGECGLDKCISVPLDVQEAIFEWHIELSEACGKPLIVHCVRAFSELIRLKKKHRPKQYWILHGFAKNADTAKMLMKEGIILSFGKDLLSPTVQAAKVLPLLKDGMFFLETDVGGVPIAGVYAAASRILEMDENELENRIERHFEHIIHRNT